MANRRKANEKIFIIKPLLVLQDKRLSPIEQDFICLIAGLQRAGGCTASNNYFAWFFGMQRRNAVRVISGLKQRGFIGSIEKKRGGKTIERTIGIIDEVIRKNLLLDSVKPTLIDSAKLTPMGLVSKMDLVSVKSGTHIIDDIIYKNKDIRQNSEEFRLAQLLQDLIISRKPDFKKPNITAWAVHIDRMIRIDHRKPSRIEQVIRWCQSDSGNGSWAGWQNNILSAAKLRQKFDKLELSMEENNGTGRVHRQDTQYKVPAEYADTAIEV